MVLALTAAPLTAARASITICHKVAGRGNTGNGYNLLTVGNAGGHANHPADLIPAPNGFCLVLFPPTTTTPPPPPPPSSVPTTAAPTTSSPTGSSSTTVPTGTRPPAGTTPTTTAVTGTLPASA